MPASSSTRLSPHFTLGEFTCHDGTPVPPACVGKYRRLCRRLLEPARETFGECRVNSGFRTTTHNQDVGGAPRSFHLCVAGRVGAAADVRFRTGSPRQWYDFLDQRGAGGLGLYDGYVHVDTRRGKARW